MTDQQARTPGESIDPTAVIERMSTQIGALSRDLAIHQVALADRDALIAQLHAERELLLEAQEQRQATERTQGRGEA